MTDRLGQQHTFLIIDETSTLSVDIESSTEINASVSSMHTIVEQFLGASSDCFILNQFPLWGGLGQRSASHFDDFYNRIHVDPLTIDLQTVASSQVRQVTVWNAYVETDAMLEDILLSNSSGIEVIGEAPAFLMKTLKELVYEVVVSTSGPPNIDVEIQFDFSNVTNPFPILVTGTRAVKFDIIPESPVVETWEWKSDLISATDGTEQRIALRGEMPRIELQLKVVFDSTELIRKFYSDLMSSGGRLWVPEFQYATRSTAASAIGTTQIYFDNSKTDIRAGDYVLVQTVNSASLIEIFEINENGALSTSPLVVEIQPSSIIIPGSPALIDNQTSIDRYSVSTVAEVVLNCKMIRQRIALSRPGASSGVSSFLTLPVLDKRPLANELVKDEVSTGQISIDNQVGYQDIISRWDYSRIGGLRTFKVNRIYNPEDMDYWKFIFAHARGKARRFWIPTYRDDLKLAIAPADASSSYTFETTQYAEKIYPIPTHRFIEIETAAGVHRASITFASIFEGNSVVSFTPSVPSGALWREVLRISYLLPVRLNDDKIEWTHYGLESLLNISIITAEVE